MPKVSVIITNYNGKKYLKACIESLKNGTFKDFEIIFVDDGSSDGSAQFVRENFKDILVVALDKNSGLAIASNRGAELAKGEYLFFYNNDTIADKAMLVELVNALESNQKIGIAGCKTLAYNGLKEINAGVQLDIFGYPYGEGDSFYVDAAIFIRRKVFDEIGGFDSKLFLYCEDRDLCWRCRLYGYDVKVVKTAIFNHDSFCAINAEGKLSSNIRKRFMGEAFTLRMLLKNYGKLSLLKILPLYFCINLAEIILFVLRGQLKIAYNAYIKAYLWNFANFKDTLRLRNIIQKERKISDKEIITKMYRGSGKFKLLKDVGVPNIS